MTGSMRDFARLAEAASMPLDPERQRLMDLFDRMAAIPVPDSYPHPRTQVEAELREAPDDLLPTWERELEQQIARREATLAQRRATPEPRRGRARPPAKAPAGALEVHDDPAWDMEAEDDPDLPWNARWPNTATLKAGTILYHGTAQRFPAGEIDGPAWFSTSRDVALWFATKYAGGASRRSRVIAYRVTDDLILPLIRGRDQFDAFTERFGIDTSSGEDMRETLLSTGLPGWYIPDNYGGDQGAGDDILIRMVGRHVEPLR